MIASLRGTVSVVQEKVLLETNNIGYLVTVSPKLAQKLSARADEQTHLYIYTHVREDALELYGFESWEERSLFLMFLSVSGVGPATAILILGQDFQAITQAIQEANVSFFTKIPRIGKKVAQKIIIELGSKLGEVKSLQLGPQSTVYQEIHESLTALGFDEHAVEEELSKLDLETAKAEDVIKDIIKILSKKRT